MQLHDIIAIGTGQAPSGCDLLDWKKSKDTETVRVTVYSEEGRRVRIRFRSPPSLFSADRRGDFSIQRFNFSGWGSSSAAGIRNHRASQIWQAAAGRLYLAVRRHRLYQVIRAGRQLAAAANGILNSFMAPVAAPLRSRTANPLRRSRRSRRRQPVAAPREWSYISTVNIPSTERREPREAQENHSGRRPYGHDKRKCGSGSRIHNGIVGRARSHGGAAPDRARP